MGFEESAIRSLEYTRGLRRKNDKFNNKLVSKTSGKDHSYTPQKMSEAALQRIKKQQGKSLIRSLIFLAFAFMLSFLLFWWFTNTQG